MKKNDIIIANSVLMIAVMFLDLDTASETGHPRSKPVRDKITKVLENYRTKKNYMLNVRANQLAEDTLKEIQTRIFGTVEVNCIAFMLLTTLEDVANLPKIYNLPSTYIVERLNELADITDNETFNRSSDTAEQILKELGYDC